LKLKLTKNEKINWRYKLLRKSKTPTKFDDHLRICWYFDEDSKQAIYEYRDECGSTNCFAITNLLQQELPELMSKKYFYPDERALIFGYFFDEINTFISSNIADAELFNFCGVTKEIFFSIENHDALLAICENYT
jgi:hypothetical protein